MEMEKEKIMEMEARQAAQNYSYSRNLSGPVGSYYRGFIAGAQWMMEQGLNKPKPRCIKDSNKECSQCHECDIDVLNPTY